jgi:hypothetical protein
MIDESDDYSLIDAMDSVLESCLLIKGSTNTNISDLCEIDRLYLTFLIREATFGDENPVIIDVPYMYKDNEYTDSVIVTSENLLYFTLTDKLLSSYDSASRKLAFTGEHLLEFRLPSIGVTSWVQKYINKRIDSGKPFDAYFAKVAPFIIDDYRNLTDEAYFSMEVDSKNWGIKDISIIDRVTTYISQSAIRGFKHTTKKGGVEVTVPLNFRNGIKSIFIISDII